MFQKEVEQIPNDIALEVISMHHNATKNATKFSNYGQFAIESLCSKRGVCRPERSHCPFKHSNFIYNHSVAAAINAAVQIASYPNLFILSTLVELQPGAFSSIVSFLKQNRMQPFGIHLF